MKTTKILKEILLVGISIAPVVYYLFLWSSLPETIPVHFDAQGNPNNYGSKTYMLLTLFFLNVGVFALMRFIPLIDPKKNFDIFKNTYYKMRFVIAVFFLIISFLIIDSVKVGVSDTSFIYILFSFLFAILGNYMGTIRPNYFIGVRTPWTLNNEEVWRKTHHLTGRIWFVAGIVMGVLMMVLPKAYLFTVFMCCLAVITIYPIVYSIFLYKRQLK